MAIIALLLELRQPFCLCGLAGLLESCNLLFAHRLVSVVYKELNVLLLVEALDFVESVQKLSFGVLSWRVSIS